jgi:hypothetical protein
MSIAAKRKAEEEMERRDRRGKVAGGKHRREFLEES